ncbi:MAG: TonB-dependent receptor [Saprospiraceae bacterium]|nr:TonB-dependent receptor [Saprospiraceae bacterium]MDW8483387.1 TonB-dependent receptor [Saprospiraceae bacterium]
MTLPGAYSQALRGRVHDALSGASIVGASIRLSSGRVEKDYLLRTDSTGSFSFEELLPGSYLLCVEATGYETLLVPELLIASGRTSSLNLDLRPAALPLPDVVVRGGKERQNLLPLGEIPLTRERVVRFPATFFDPARLAFAYAGIANADDQANGLLIRGNSPLHVRWRLEGVEIVNPNHLPNAGTVSDRPATTFGGVSLFSAQLLDNSTLLTGALPAGYGDAFGGILDVYWRGGNKEDHAFTAQVGLLGIDLAAEGPINRQKTHSYLLNYRYSTVGLLEQMGISFGNEKIQFQDFCFKTTFSGKREGQWAILGAFGNSKNRFTPPGDSSAARQFKDLFNIDFYSNTNIFGITWNNSAASRTRIFFSIVNSFLDNLRVAEARGLFDEQDTLREGRMGMSLRLSTPVRKRGYFQSGLLAQRAELHTGAKRRDSLLYTGTLNTFTLQPWANMQWLLPGERTRLQVGLHTLFWWARSYALQVCVEPRLTLTHYLYEYRHQITLYAGLNSQTHPLWVYALHPRADISETSSSLEGSPIARGFQVSTRYTWAPNDEWRTWIELFYQYQQRMPSTGAIHLANVSEQQPLGRLVAGGLARNAGVELSVERFFVRNWFLLANASLLQAHYRGLDGVWRSSRWNIGHIVNLTAGKEWTFDRWPRRLLAFGVSGRLNWMGGQRAAPLDIAASAAAQATIYDFSQGFPFRLPDFVRLDLRAYWRRHLGKRRNSWLAFELQNATLRNNIAYYYYDPLLRRIQVKNQLGLVPNISWRLEW